MLSSTASEAARQHPGGRGKWEAPIIYPTPPWNPPIVYPTPTTPWNPPIIYPSPIKPPPRSGHVDIDLPSFVDEQAPSALPEDPADLSSAQCMPC
ncbi:hypothetical protein BAE44_0023716 [Dichanthelium oligosanthes]|uniref:Uncharacterized protein n=1 Tax=Dichanthelium oligosanthes TaxID=888268 RepID=A0A1E5UQW4_9POAL|nr:hypothetical protein BAE44_0023716 [Dichanthelium oligosanthes]